jgi:hypothetical protein
MELQIVQDVGKDREVAGGVICDKCLDGQRKPRRMSNLKANFWGRILNRGGRFVKS